MRVCCEQKGLSALAGEGGPNGDRWARFDDITSPPRLPLRVPFPPFDNSTSSITALTHCPIPCKPPQPPSGGTSVQHCLLTAWQPQPGSPRPPLGRTRTSPPARTQLHISLSNSGSGSALWRSGPSQPAGKSSEKIDSTTRHNTDKHKTQLATQALQISRTSPIHVSESRKIDIRMEKSKVEHEI